MTLMICHIVLELLIEALNLSIGYASYRHAIHNTRKSSSHSYKLLSHKCLILYIHLSTYLTIGLYQARAAI